MLDKGNIPIPCPQCGRKTTKSIGWLKTHSQYRCACGLIVNVKRDQFLREMRKVDDSIARFKRSLGRIGKV